MNYNLPIPLDDELALGLLGRFARLNGMSSIAWAIKSIKGTFQESLGQPVLWQIARACALDASDFTAKHSMIPVLHPISRYVGSERETGHRRNLALVSGLSTPTTGLRWCPDCARQSQLERGFSYWRRYHQINGIDWCSTHHVPLVTTEADFAISSPRHSTIQGQTTLPLVDLEKELGNPALHRLQYILSGWLQRPQPFHLRAWCQVVSQKCRDLNLRIGEIGKRAVASDLILEQLPHSWLRRHMPEVASKQARSFVRKVDGACIDKHVTYPALACATILSVLFESAELALAELESANRALTVEIIPEKAIDHAFAMFLSGVGLHEACELSGASIQDVEAALRNNYRFSRRSEAT